MMTGHILFALLLDELFVWSWGWKGGNYAIKNGADIRSMTTFQVDL
jgi:hypothetical protein